MTFVNEKPLASLIGKFLLLLFMVLRPVAMGGHQSKVRQVILVIYFLLLSLALAVHAYYYGN